MGGREGGREGGNKNEPSAALCILSSSGAGSPSAGQGRSWCPSGSPSPGEAGVRGGRCPVFEKEGAKEGGREGGRGQSCVRSRLKSEDGAS